MSTKNAQVGLKKRTNSQNIHEKHTFSEIYTKNTNSLNIHEKRTCSQKGRHFCEFCENEKRFPWVEFVDFRKFWGGVGG